MSRELPHEKKQRDNRKVIVREPCERQVVQIDEEGCDAAVGEQKISRRTGDEHCYSDRHAEREEKHQSAENEKGGLRPAHRTLLSKEPYALRSDNAAI